MVDNPNTFGTFDPALSPVVKIFDTNQPNTSIATFTTTTDSGSETVRVDSTDSSYIANWKTTKSLDTTKTWRIQVSVGNNVLGFIDASVVSRASQLKNVDSSQYVPILQGTTVPIKFSIMQGISPPPDPKSCKEIKQTNPNAADGIYTIAPEGNPIDVICDMTMDGGGWTLVGNFPWPGNTNGVAGWTSGNQIGATFTDITQPFKLSDSLINSPDLKTYAYRAHGEATFCCSYELNAGTACTVNTTLYWDGSCVYNSGALGYRCGEAYVDPLLTTRLAINGEIIDDQTCGWHWGLVASNCVTFPGNTLVAFGTGHIGDHVFVGQLTSPTHAYDGRPGENPSIQFWVK